MAAVNFLVACSATHDSRRLNWELAGRLVRGECRTQEVGLPASSVKEGLQTLCEVSETRSSLTESMLILPQ